MSEVIKALAGELKHRSKVQSILMKYEKILRRIRLLDALLENLTDDEAKNRVYELKKMEYDNLDNAYSELAKEVLNGLVRAITKELISEVGE